MPKHGVFRRRILLINPGFQRWFISYMLGTAAATTAIYYCGLRYFLMRVEEMGQSIGLPKTHLFFKFLEHQNVLLNTGFVVIGAVTILVLVTSGIFLSHRIAGPIYHLNEHMKSIARGETKGPVHFREKDFFPELAENYNLHMEFLAKSSKRNAA